MKYRVGQKLRVREENFDAIGSMMVPDVDPLPVTDIAYMRKNILLVSNRQESQRFGNIYMMTLPSGRVRWFNEKLFRSLKKLKVKPKPIEPKKLGEIEWLDKVQANFKG